MHHRPVVKSFTIVHNKHRLIPSKAIQPLPTDTIPVSVDPISHHFDGMLYTCKFVIKICQQNALLYC